ncbi:prephenate dehydratase domain-containing protein [Neobacillus massiliamazoniensis]|uniref:prephenate dehydratase n=1 Tax=Neobacillus massiliamazoniensis TaxID=1499688 RepID=A0A0U1P368_9BACI|nr:prephenate dehydratase domain-containing protein [Neobacillus massiliamazoniensis]CRK84794.1 prephenate dehydratase [Neobacillus massiliamazoniensis]
MIVSICGIKGCYAETAAVEVLGEGISLVYFNSFQSALDSVKNQRSEYAVLPVKTSNSGYVSEVNDLLSTDNWIVKQKIDLNTHHCLMALKGEKLISIKTVYSHPKALQECELYLRKLNVSLQEFFNTAASAKHVAENNLLKSAAIASKQAANLYGLEILAENIENNNDVTTFYVIGY